MKNMKIYCTHSSWFDYQKDWYEILRASPIAQEHELIFPHESPEIQQNSYPVLQTVDCVLAEVSFHSTGMGIELGWSQIIGKPIFCFYRQGTKPSTALEAVSKNCVEYSSSSELILKISHLISHEMNNTL